jgi:hypothetical protein
VNFNYTGATAGKTLSAVVLSGGGAVKYYGKLVGSTGTSGSASVTLPGGFLSTDTVQIFVEEANGDNLTDFASGYKQLSLTVPVGTAPTITTTGLAAGTAGTAYSATLAATGTAPITWGVESGSLPAGLSLNASTGAITGTPTTAGTSNFTVKATNSAGSATKALSITVSPAGGGGTPTPTKYIKLWGKETKYVDNFGNWLMVIFLFGWIWMAF